MRFLIDAQLPPALARWLAERGHEASHVFDIGMGQASDKDIWSHATDSGAVIVTKDEDFVILRLAQGQGPAIVWVRLGNTRRTALLASMETLMSMMIEALERGETLIEIA